MLTRLLALAVVLAAVTVAAGDPESSVEALRAARVARLTTPDGWLTLIGRHLLSPGENSIGTAADNSIRLAAGPPYLGTVTLNGGKVRFAPAPGAVASIDGAPAHPAELVYQGDKPTHVSFGSANFYVMDRGGSLYLRVKDRAAERLSHFTGLDYFPLDPAWRVTADWVPFPTPQTVEITNVLGQVSPATVPGKAVFTHDGHMIELLPVEQDTDGSLFFVLSDLTTGEETYPGGRFLYTDGPKDGKVVLDFNLAENPPCAFTPFATCPLPPKENRMTVAVRAGEKIYRGPH